MQGKHRWIEGLSIKWRLALIMFLVILLAVVCITAFLSMQSYRVMSGQVLEINSQLVDCAASGLTDRLDESLRVANLVLSQEMVTDAVKKAHQGGRYPLSDQLDDARQITDFLKSLESSSDLVRIRLSLSGKTLYGNDQVNFFRLREEEQSRLSALLLEGRYFDLQWTTFDYIFRNSRRIVSLVRPITSARSFFEVIGAVSVDVDAQELEQLLQGVLVNEGDAAVLYDRAGQPVLRLGDESLAALSAQGSAQGCWQRDRAASALLYELPIGPDGWILSYRVREEALYLPLKRLMERMAWVLVAALLVSLVLAITSGTAQSRRLLRLVHAMDRVREGEMDVRVEEGPGNEIGRMERSFNFLLDQLQRTMDAKVEDTRQLGLMEMQLLQSQINPHFLYNTLNLFCWRLTKRGDQEGARSVQALAQFYRIGLNHGKELITLEEELQHVQLYVEIQNFRLEDKIRLQITLTPDCKRLLMPGNILQPLVENAINAGILEKPEGCGTVEIVCRSEGEDLLIVVSDDGVGMDIARMQQLLAHRDEKHYGAWNVHKRLALRYGEGYGLRYSLNEQGGVRVEVRLPAGSAR